MKNFIKPETVTVSDKEYIQSLVNANLKKDLHDNEEICKFCHGTGMVIEDNSYGLSNDPNKQIARFPYKHQSISFCQHCYKGIIHRCKLCGEVMPRGSLKHDCEQQRRIDRVEREKKKAEILDKAPIAPKEVEEATYYLFSEFFPYNNGYFSDWDEFFDAWEENNEPNDKKPEFVWITEEHEMHIDAQDVVETATQDLYEDAIDNISRERIEELQEYLNNWCKTCGVGNTYYGSHEYKVRIPWDEHSAL